MTPETRRYPWHIARKWQGPKFLFRKETTEGNELSDKVVRQVINREIDWAKPRDPAIARAEAKEASLRRLQTQIRNRDIPVEVSYQVKGMTAPGLLHRFDDMDAFEAWYNPAVHNCTVAVSTMDHTILYSHLPEWAAKREMGSPKTEKTTPKATSPAPRAKVTSPGKAAPRAPSAPRKGRYVDIRHVRQMADAGWAFHEGTPNHFTKGKQRVDIAPPPKGKTWSSGWTVGKVSGRGIGALLKALEG